MSLIYSSNPIFITSCCN